MLTPSDDQRWTADQLRSAIRYYDQVGAPLDEAFVCLSDLAKIDFYVDELKVLKEQYHSSFSESGASESGLEAICGGEIGYRLTLKSPGGIVVTLISEATAAEMNSADHCEEKGIFWSDECDTTQVVVMGVYLVDDEGAQLDMSEQGNQQAVADILAERIDFEALWAAIAPMRLSSLIRRDAGVDSQFWD